MKKLLIMLFLLVLPLSVNAANGDVNGNIYSTNIRAYINNVEVESYNIGGKTAVVLEDILKPNLNQLVYNDNTRTLTIWSLNPQFIVEGKNNNSKKPGTVIGKTYETDIKAIIYDTTIPSYNIGGKTAVAIEDLGKDNDFSLIGGKFIWSESERTIKLEFMYDNADNIIPQSIVMNVAVNDDISEGAATFVEKFHCGGGSVFNSDEESAFQKNNIDILFPIKAQEEIIGYFLRRPSKDYLYPSILYLYPEKFEEAIKLYTPLQINSREEVINHFCTYHSVGSISQRFDADEYSFVQITTALTSDSVNYLIQAYDDGRYIDYLDGIHNSKQSIRNLIIDEQNQKVTFKYEDRYNSDWFTNYEIDLKLGTIKEV